MIYGLRLGHGRGHLARAAMEGVAHCLADVRDALPAAAPDAGPTRLTGGITRTPLWAQIVADVVGEPLAAIEAADASATGAALVGLRALGQLSSGGGAAGGAAASGRAGASAADTAGSAAGASAGSTYTPGSDRDFYVRQRRAYGALRKLMREQAAVATTDH
jgi:gluconokinase